MVEREQRVLDRVKTLRDKGMAWDAVAADLNGKGASWAPRSAAAWTTRNLAKVVRD